MSAPPVGSIVTVRERVIATLKAGSLCDDCLAEVAGISPRQSVNQKCAELKREGVLERDKSECPRCRRYKLVNLLGPSVPESVAGAPERDGASKPWYWEGEVQARIVEHLRRRGFREIRSADTSSREAGIDIEAVAPEGRKLWVTVKGWPERSSNVQARHWFAGAVLDVVLHRERSRDAELAIGIPDGFATYRNLARRLTWLKGVAPFTFFWVLESGDVREE
jgi:biotin operon repressor